jgi:multiple PDZ domain protein
MVFCILQSILGGSLQNLIPASDRLVKAKSDGSLASSATAGTDSNSFSRMKSRSLEPLTGLAMWSSEPQVIELVKGDRGLGFSILDYQVNFCHKRTWFACQMNEFLNE